MRQYGAAQGNFNGASLAQRASLCQGDAVPKTEPLMTTFEVAVRLGCSISTVQRRARSGELRPAQKLPGPNGALLFDPRDVDRLLTQAKAS